LSTSSEVLHVLRVRRERRTGEALLVTEAWLPADLAETITIETLLHTALYRALSEAGVTIDRMQHEITAEIAGPRIAQLLDTAIGSALLRVNRIAFTAGKVHHLNSVIMNPNRSRILIEADDAARVAIAHDVRRRGNPG
jgi:GntR family transcriptional regulator